MVSDSDRRSRRTIAVNEAETIRLFVAIPVPDAVKENLSTVQRELRQLVPEASIRWTPPEQIHLTLRFFGGVSSEALPELMGALDSACESSPPLDMQARGLGVFPPKRDPRVIWVGVHDGQNQLGSLQQRIENATAQFGEKPDEREFSAHLTLARIKHLRSHEVRTLREFITARADRACGEWPAGEIELIRSELGSGGARHSIISVYALRNLR
jgi:2'-5' RNA ligase